MVAPIVVASHRRSGTHLLIDSLLSNLTRNSVSSRIPMIKLDYASSHVYEWDLSTNQLRECIERGCLVKSHAHGHMDRFFNCEPALAELVEKLILSGKWLYIHRDGRDVLTSLYYYHAGFDKKIRSLSFSEYIRMPNDFDSSTYRGAMNRAEYWGYHVESWLDKHGTMMISYEDLRDDYDVVLRKVADFLGEDVANHLIDVRLSANGTLGRIAQKLKSRFYNLVSQRRVHTSVSFRRGQIGDWRKVFSQADLGFFQKHAGDVNAALGYESAEEQGSAKTRDELKSERD